MFRFGNNVHFPSTEEVTIPLNIGKLESTLHVCVVDANIPLLLGRPDMKKLGFIVDFEKDTVKTSITYEVFVLDKTEKSHLALPFFQFCLSEEIMALEDCTREEKVKNSSSNASSKY